MLASFLCLFSIATVYIQNKYKNKISHPSTKDNKAACSDNSFDNLFNSNYNPLDQTNHQNQSNCKTKGFLIRAMTLPQDVIRTVGKTVQLESNSNSFYKECNKDQTLSSFSNQQLSNSLTSNSFICTTCIPAQQNSTSLILNRPYNFKKITAIKSPASNYLKKCPSPTDQNNSSLVKTPNSECSNESMNTSNNLKEKNCEINQISAVQFSNNYDSDQIENKLKNNDDEFDLGVIQFNLKYNYEKHAIFISKIKCKNLRAKNTIDTFVKLQLFSEKQYKMKTRTIRKNLNPEYEEEFTFLNIFPTQLDSISIHFTVMGFDRYSRDEVLGESLHQLKQTQFDTLEKQIYIVQKLKPKGALTKINRRGEILVSLCCNPVANILSLVVLNARNLPKMDITGLCDPYVKIKLFFNNKRIAKKKTRVQKKTLNPVFNETFLFNLPSELSQCNYQLDDNKVALELWKKVKLELILLDYDRVTRNETIGKLVLSLDSKEASIREHLQEIITSPRKQIASTHNIVK